MYINAMGWDIRYTALQDAWERVEYRNDKTYL